MVAVRQARAIAKQWVAEEVGRLGGETLGAFTYGSINWMADDEPLPPSSDLDLVLVVPRVEPARHRILKRSYDGIVIEASHIAHERLLSAEAVLADGFLAPNLVQASVLFDPLGIVDGLQRAIRPDFRRQHWVRERCRALREYALAIVSQFEQSESLVYLNAVACLAVRAMGQMALLAALGNPTVKKVLVKACEVLAAHGLTDQYQELLRLLRYTDLDDATILKVASHCRQAQVEACPWLRTPFPGDNCVSPCSLPALDLDVPACVEHGSGREIFLWVETLYEHAMIALHNDAPPAVAAAATEVYVADMAAIGSATVAEARQRLLPCRPALDRMLAVCDDIVERNADVVD
jgi:hypothetical protein